MKMKKYLMTGIAALALCAGFTSCSHDLESLSQEEIEQLEAQRIVEKYNKAFLDYIGASEIAATQTWGFGSTAGTRTRAGKPGDPTYVGAYPNANQWASQGFSVPDPLEPGQKLRVQYYFQMNKITNPNRPNYGQIDFFMQQVYDGGDDPMTEYNKETETVDGKVVYKYSPEVYKAADGNTEIKSGEHMDHLTCGPDHTHTYNFNNGTCSPNSNVGDNGAALDTDQHTDRIQLMVNTKTSCFGYANSDASCVRDDRWTLVSYEIIDAFCDNASNGYEAWRSANHSDIKDVRVTDDWKRSFIGFDFDMLPDSTIFAGQYVDANGQVINDLYHDSDKIHHKDYDYFSIDLKGKDKVWNGTELVDATTIGEWGTDRYNNPKFYPYMPGTTERIHLLDASSNMYCGEVDKNWSDNDWKYNEEYTNISKMITALNDGKLPKNDKEWILVGNCADGYYSDWIVSFKPATSGEIIIDNPDPYSIRVMAEDLSVADPNHDFDFNDVVIDVYYTPGKTATGEINTGARIVLQAAGGTLPLRICGNDNWEVHKLFGVEQNVMVNTHWGGSNGTDKEPYEFTFDGFAPTPNSEGVVTEEAFLAAVRDQITLEVKKTLSTGMVDWYTMTADPANPASKFAVPVGTDWCDERISIKTQHPTFADWARTGEDQYKWW